MEMKRVDFDLFFKRDINIMLDINVNSVLFNCKEEGPCKSGLVIHYHKILTLFAFTSKIRRNPSRQLQKGDKILQSWLKRAIKIAASS
ncbi:MAG: hypothetical protein CM1200mP16_17240 [Nitrospina sp.]|nr:MAG: hypothetical protein CM1200mP16_17240 [Nitrospina sp.]